MKIHTLIAIIITLWILLVQDVLAQSGNQVYLDFGFYELFYNCNRGGYDYSTYQTVPDSGSLPRYKTFHHELRLPLKCRKKSKNTFKRPNGETQYHRGHGVHSNIWDHSNSMMRETNSMANIVPHEAYQNTHGLWRYTEKLTECYRDLATLRVWLGNIWGTNENNDHFKNSHGVATPDYLWKVIVRDDGEINAWILPNDNQANRQNADLYKVSIASILDNVSYEIPTLERYRNDKVSNTWWLPKGCSIK